MKSTPLMYSQFIFTNNFLILVLDVNPHSGADAFFIINHNTIRVAFTNARNLNGVTLKKPWGPKPPPTSVSVNIVAIAPM